MFGFKIIYGKLGDSLLKLLEAAEGQISEAAEAALELDKVRRETSKLRAERDEEHAKYERREREIEHMLGLERKRQETDLDLAKRQAILEVREENLKADRNRFEQQMQFHEKRFAEEVGYLKTIIGDLAERLPTSHSERIETINRSSTSA